MKYNIAIAGATGNVGRKIIEVLERRNFPLDNLYLLASKKSAGKEIVFKEKKLIIEELESFDFSKATITFFVVDLQSPKRLLKKQQNTVL